MHLIDSSTSNLTTMDEQMNQDEFFRFKTYLEQLSISDIIKKGPGLLTSHQKSDILWIVLDRKIRVTFWYKGRRGYRQQEDERTPALEEVLKIKSPKHPPFQVIRTFIEMARSIDDYKRLVDCHPYSVSIQLQNGDILLHRVVEKGGYNARHFINSIIFKSVVSDVGKDRLSKFGGLTTKNNSGRSPLIMLFGLIVAHVTRYPNSEKWFWLTNVIQKVVHIQLHKATCKFHGSIFENGGCLSPKELEKTPLLHAALQIDCPLGLLNRIVDSCTIDEFCTRDSFGNIPLVVALSNKASYAEIVMTLFRKTPVKALKLLKIEKEGDLPLHRILKAGIKYQISSGGSDVALISTIAGTAPDALFSRDEIYQMPPFMLACIENQWSVDIVFGLLRAGPFAIQPYIY